MMHFLFIRTENTIKTKWHMYEEGKILHVIHILEIISLYTKVLLITMVFLFHPAHHWHYCYSAE